MMVFNKRERARQELRDKFAAFALAGISAHISGATKNTSETASEAHARWAYATADAMMKARGL